MTEKKAKLRINVFMIKLMIDNSKGHFHRKCEGIPFVSKERILIGFTTIHVKSIIMKIGY